MNLSTDLISQFAKITNDGKDKKKETTVYGTTVENEGVIYVKLDGSDLLTPVLSAADTKANERVIVMIKNHTATITGNLSSPAARYDDVKKVVDLPARMTRVELELDDKINKEDGMGLSQENFTTEEKDKLSKLENYDDTELSSRVGVLETNLGGHTVKTDVPADAVFTDTVYDDTELLERVSNVERDYSTKEYVAEQIAGASHLTREIVTSVPTAESAKENVIYMLKVNDATGPDIYQEYQKIGTEVVLIGDTSVDLTDYAKKDDLPDSYDDTELSSRVGVLETNLGGHTVKSDVPANAVFTDTIYDDTELSSRVGVLETDLGGHTVKSNVPADAVFTDTIYDDTELSSRVGVLETDLGGHTVKSDVPANAVFTDTIYDDSKLSSRVGVLETNLGGHTVKTDVPADAVFTDTIYDDSKLSSRVGVLETNLGGHTVKSNVPANAVFTDTIYDDSKLSSRVGVLETNLGGHTVKSDVPANAVFTDTIYDDTELSNRVKTIENDYAKSEDIPIVTNDLTDELKTKYDKAVEDIEGLKESPLPNITEQGVIGIWTYTKWANNDVELWGVYEITNSICNTPLGGIYFTDIDNSVKFGGMFRTGVFEPDAFPFEVYNAKLVSSYESDAQGAILWAVTSTTSKKPPNYYLVRPTISTIESGKIIFHVVGKLTV